MILGVEMSVFRSLSLTLLEPYFKRVVMPPFTSIIMTDGCKSSFIEKVKLITKANSSYSMLIHNSHLIIFRALEVFKDHGKRLSEIIEDQRRLPGSQI